MKSGGEGGGGGGGVGEGWVRGRWGREGWEKGRRGGGGEGGGGRKGGKEKEKGGVLVVAEKGFGKRSKIDDYRITNRGGKGVKTLNITDKTGKLVALKNVTDENDLMIINKSGIAIRTKVADLNIIGRATQGVRLINLGKRNDEIASVCKVLSQQDEEIAEEKAEMEVIHNDSAIFDQESENNQTESDSETVETKE